MSSHPGIALRSSIRRRSSVFLAMLCLAFVLGACGGASGAASASSGGASPSETQTCNKSTGLTVYSAQGYDSDATKAFQQQTGITTKLVDDSTGNILAKISAEGSNPEWDVVWFDGNVTMQSLDDQGLLLKWQSPAVSNLTAEGASYVASDGSYYPTGLTTM